MNGRQNGADVDGKLVQKSGIMTACFIDFLRCL